MALSITLYNYHRREQNALDMVSEEGTNRFGNCLFVPTVVNKERTDNLDKSLLFVKHLADQMKWCANVGGWNNTWKNNEGYNLLPEILIKNVEMDLLK
jgi:hypothetical protein